MKELNLIGLFRSGTNYTRTLLELNYETQVRYNALGWKHGVIPTYTKDSGYRYPELPTITVVKEPFAVLDSWLRYFKKRGKNLRSEFNGKGISSFIRNRIVYFNEAAETSPEYRFVNPVQMWNFVVWNHLSFVKKNGGIVLKYEDLIRDPETACQKVAEKFGLQRKSGEFVIPEYTTRNMNDSGERYRSEDYMTGGRFERKEYFAGREYLKKFSPRDREFIRKELDPELLDMLGYGELIPRTESE